MRHLILTRGTPGCGKDTFIKNNGLEQYMLSADDIRILFQTPVMTDSGEYQIDARHDKKVWKLLFELLEERMKRGEFTIVNATHSKTEAINRYRKLAQKYRYRVTILDFSDVPLEKVLKQNKMRPEYKHVPEAAILNIQERMTTEKVPSWVSSVKPDEFMEYIKYSSIDLSNWKKIHHIGDIHGCNTALQEYLGPEGIKDDELYIFVGDYLDRGIENVETINFLLTIYNKPNVIMLEGNHEHHLKTWSHDDDINSKHFKDTTKVELENQFLENVIVPYKRKGLKGLFDRITRKTYVHLKKEINYNKLTEFKKEIRQFYRKLRQVVYYTYDGITVVVTHGGISKRPDEFMLMSTEQFIKGVGDYNLDIDYAWQQNEASINQAFQIHGHRNIYRLPTMASENSFNLEGQVEKGGHLRVVTLTADGFEVHEVKNNVFKINKDNRATDVDETIDEATFIQYLRSHEMIQEKEQGDNISSFNFTRDAFEKRNWDGVNVKARGLFVNTETNEIVSRSYNKFFNVGERDETKIAALADNLVYPVIAYDKPNGYLGTIGYNSEKDELVFTSKSEVDGPHAQWLKELFLSQVNSDQIESIKLFLREEKVSLVFEVIKVLEDPHIIKYDTDKLVLLDIVKRTVKYEKLDYDYVAAFARMYGFEFKSLEMKFESWMELYSWYRDMMNNLDIQREGFVLEDASGFMTKIKLPYYNFWKQMRGVKDKVAAKRAHEVKGGSLYTPLHNKVFSWMKKQDFDYLKKSSIINLRDDFYKESLELISTK